MKKKLLALFLVLILTLSLCACGSKDGNVDNYDSNVTQEPAEPVQEEVVEPEPEPEPEPVKEIEFSTVTCEKSDNDGYQFLLTFKYSPWLSVENDWDLIEAYWNSLGTSNSLPGTDVSSSWGWKHYSYGWRANYEYHPTQYMPNVEAVYYCIGTLKVENTTPNWNITSDVPVSVKFMLNENGDEMPKYNDGSCFVMQAFYSSGKKYHVGQAEISAHMTTNTWGELPVVIAFFDSKTPNNPDGTYKDQIHHHWVLQGYNRGNETYFEIPIYNAQ